MSGNETSQPSESKPLRILYLEDSEVDQDLVRIGLARQRLRCDLSCVFRLDDFRQALEKETFDVILCDSTGPEFEGKRALDMVRQQQPAAAFLFLTGHRPGPLFESMKTLGADGLISKDDMQILGAGIIRAVEARQVH